MVNQVWLNTEGNVGWWRGTRKGISVPWSAVTAVIYFTLILPRFVFKSEWFLCEKQWPKMYPKTAVMPFKPKTYVLHKPVYFPIFTFSPKTWGCSNAELSPQIKVFQAVCQKYSNIVLKLLAEEQLGHNNCQLKENSVRNVMKINKKEKVFHTYA